MFQKSMLNKLMAVLAFIFTCSAPISRRWFPHRFSQRFPRKRDAFKRGVNTCWDSGVSFATSPVPADRVVTGYMKAGFWVSSTSNDMDTYASLRVIDDHGREVNYAGPPDPRDPSAVYPLGIGFPKVSHRKLDVKRSTDYRPKHTDAASDYAPLQRMRSCRWRSSCGPTQR